MSPDFVHSASHCHGQQFDGSRHQEIFSHVGLEVPHMTSSIWQLHQSCESKSTGSHTKHSMPMHATISTAGHPPWVVARRASSASACSYWTPACAGRTEQVVSTSKPHLSEALLRNLTKPKQRGFREDLSTSEKFPPSESSHALQGSGVPGLPQPSGPASRGKTLKTPSQCLPGGTCT